MKFILNKNFKVERGGIFPLLELPNLSGEKQDWNDFQWWAPTKNFNDWLKKNPREWQAESINNTSYDLYSLLESEIYSNSPRANKEIAGFDHFTNQIYEADSEAIKGAIEDSKEGKEYIKFIYALNKANNEGKISTSFASSELLGAEKAIIFSLPDETGKRTDGTDFAIKMGGGKSAGNIIIVDANEMIPGGKIPENSTFKEVLVKFSNFIGGFLKSAIVPTMAVVALVYGGKQVFSFLKRSVVQSALKSAGFGKNAKTELGFFKGALKVFRQSFFRGAFKEGPASLRFFKGAKQAWNAAGGVGKVARFGKAIKGGYSAVNTVKNVRAAARLAKTGVTAAKVGTGAATAALNAIGVGEVLMAVGAAQQAYNWFSNKQAPRYGQIEGKVPGASSVFNPGQIGDGQAITVCWTQEAGSSSVGGAIASIFISSDTRTTMDLIKIGNIGGKAIFLLVSIKSAEFAKVLKSSQMIFLAFGESSSFKHGTFDNDDLEFEFIPIKNVNEISTQLVFEGSTDWSYFTGIYKTASSEVIKVNEKAPSTYDFNFKNSEGEIINVKGKLIKSSEEIKKGISKKSGGPESSKESDGGSSKSGSERKSILQSAFNLDNNDSEAKYVETEGAKNNDSYSFRVKGYHEFILEEEGSDEKKDGDSGQDKIKEESASEGEKNNLSTGPAEIAMYQVEESFYADDSEGKKYDGIDSFIVPPTYFDSGDGDKIEVDLPIEAKDEKKGIAKITAKETEIPTDQKKSDKDSEEKKLKSIEDSKEGSKLVDRGEKGTGVSKIKDTNKEDTWNPSQYLSDADKSELGIKDWKDGVRKVKIYRDDNGKPTMVKIKSYNRLSTDSGERKKNFKEGDAGFEKAVEFAEKVEKELGNEN